MIKIPKPSLSGARARLFELSKEQGASLARLSDLIGRNPAYLQQFINRGSPRKLEERDRRTLADYFGVDESELGSPEEKSYKYDRKKLLKSAPNRPDNDNQWLEVPRLDVGASAGPGAFNVGEQPFDSFRFSKRWLRENGLGDADLSSVSVEGDSMEPMLRDGDEILVDTSKRPFRDGVYVVRLGDSLMVKRVASAGQGRLALLSQNMAYPTVEVGGDEVELIGRVVWKGGKI
ncbi:MAG: S24 family peptidase [Erythrobacter sp.]